LTFYQLYTNGGGVGSAFLTAFSVATSSSSYTFTGLSPTADYKFSIRAENKHGLGPWSADLAVQTIGPPSKPPQPLLIQS